MYDLEGSGSVRGVEDLAHEQGLEGLPHHLVDGAGLHVPHDAVAVRR